MLHYCDNLKAQASYAFIAEESADVGIKEQFLFEFACPKAKPSSHASRRAFLCFVHANIGANTEALTRKFFLDILRTH